MAAPAKAAKGLWGRTKARLGKKVGPLPLWGWLALAGIGVVYYIRRQNAAAATTATPDTTATPADTSATDPLAGGTTDTGSGGGTTDTGSGGGTSGGGGSVSPTVDTSPSVAPSGADAVSPSTSVSPAPGPIAGAPSARGAPKDSLIATSRTGAKLYETSTGAILEQVKGKSPFRAAAAGSAAAKRILANVTKPGNPLRTAGATAKVAAKPRPKAKAAPARHTAHVQKKTVRARGGKI